MFEVATETDLSRANRQPGRQHAGEVTKKKNSNQKVEGPPAFRKTFNSEFGLRGNQNERDFGEEDDYDFDKTPYRQLSSTNSSQSASTGKGVQEDGQAQREELFENNPRGHFYFEANQRARLIQELETERKERFYTQYNRAFPEAMDQRLQETRWRNQLDKRLNASYRPLKPTPCHKKCEYCEFRGTECYGAEEKGSNGCETCQRIGQKCYFLPGLEVDVSSKSLGSNDTSRIEQEREIKPEEQYSRLRSIEILSKPGSSREQTRVEQAGPSVGACEVFPKSPARNYENQNGEAKDIYTKINHEIYDSFDARDSHATPRKRNESFWQISAPITTSHTLFDLDERGHSDRAHEGTNLKTDQYPEHAILNGSTNDEDGTRPQAPPKSSKTKIPNRTSKSPTSHLGTPEASIQLEDLSRPTHNINPLKPKTRPPKQTVNPPLPLKDRLENLLRARAKNTRVKTQTERIEPKPTPSQSYTTSSAKFIDTGFGLLRSERYPSLPTVGGDDYSGAETRETYNQTQTQRNRAEGCTVQSNRNSSADFKDTKYTIPSLNRSPFRLKEDTDSDSPFWRHWTHDLPHRERDP
jgi:hypothetical protein